MQKDANMKRYRIFKRKNGIYFLEDNKTKKQESLRTKDPEQAERVAFHRNESDKIAAGHRQIGIGYLQAGDPGIRTRTWSDVADSFCALPVAESTLRRKLNAMKDPAIRGLFPLLLIETMPEQLVVAINKGTVSTNTFLRKLHNHAKRMKWLPEEILTRGTWPPIVYGDKRAITRDEHELIMKVTPTKERRSFNEVLWQTGGSQTDIANLTAEQIDWEEGSIRFKRIKMGKRKAGFVTLTMGPTLEAILEELPQTGLLFPTLAGVGENDRATAFAKHCEKAGVEGVTLHSYRYAVIQRAQACGFSKRHAMAMVGQSREQTHNLYARGGATVVPSLEEWELNFQSSREQRLKDRAIRREKIIALRDRMAA